MGGGYKFGEDTVWFDKNPIIHNWDNIPDFKFDENSEMWGVVKEMTEYFVSNANMDYICSISDIGGNFDILASLRNTQELLFDIIDYPDEIKKAIDKIQNSWMEMYNRLYDIISEKQDATTTWMPIWSDKKWYALQCDFYAMISPNMFEEFVMPTLQKEAQFLGRSIYHLDGLGEIPHLDHILDIQEIDGIQWTAGAGKPNEGDEIWYPMYKKILARGKRLVLLDISSEKVIPLIENIGNKGVYIHTGCKNQHDAQALIKLCSAIKLGA